MRATPRSSEPSTPGVCVEDEVFELAPWASFERTKLVDSKGENLSFEAALKKLVDADPDRESIVRSKLAQGANSKTNTNAKPATQESSEVRGVTRISAILAANGGLKASGK